MRNEQVNTITYAEAGRELGVSRQRIHALCREGKLAESVRFGRKGVYYPSLEEYRRNRVSEAAAVLVVGRAR